MVWAIIALLAQTTLYLDEHYRLRGQIMEKTVGAFEVRRSFGRILQEVSAGGDRVVVERNGQPVAVVVPIDVYNQWKRSRADFFERIRRTSERANLTPDDADQVATDAVRAVRASQE